MSEFQEHSEKIFQQAFGRGVDVRALEAFRLLGIPQDSDRAAIAQAYRRLARTTHPDVSDQADAAERFADLAEAYRIASTSPGLRPPDRPGGAASVQWSGTRTPLGSPIVAGPVRVMPSAGREEGGHRG